MTENERPTVNPDKIVTLVPESYPELQDEIDRIDFNEYKKALESRRSQCIMCSNWQLVNGIAVCSDPPSSYEQCTNYKSRGW